MEKIILNPNKNYYLHPAQHHVSLSAPKQSSNIIYAPKGYTIAGLFQYTVSNEQYVEIDLDTNLKVWNIINGVPPHNSLQGLQGGAPGEYYHLTKAQWKALTQGAAGVGSEVVINQNLSIGDNTVIHNLGQIPVVITFWVNGIQSTFAPKVNVDPSNNFFTVNASRAVSNVRIYVRALGTT